MGTHLCQFLPSLRSTVRIHCPLLLMRNDDDDQLLLLLANEDKLTSAAHHSSNRKSASPRLYNTKGFPVGDLSVTHLMLLSVAMTQPMPLVVLLLFAFLLPSLGNETGLQYEPPPRQGFTSRKDIGGSGRGAMLGKSHLWGGQTLLPGCRLSGHLINLQ